MVHIPFNERTESCRDTDTETEVCMNPRRWSFDAETKFFNNERRPWCE